jgi:hypothetical protein
MHGIVHPLLDICSLHEAELSIGTTLPLYSVLVKYSPFIENSIAYKSILNNCTITSQFLISVVLLQYGLPNLKVGFSKALSCGWIKVTKQGKDSVVTRKVDSIMDTVQEHLRHILANNTSQVDERHKQEYRKRKLLQEL